MGRCTKGGPKVWRFFLIVDVLISPMSHFHSLLSYGNNPQWLPRPFLSGFCIWVIGQARGSLSAHRFPPVWIVAKIVWSCLCLFDVIVEYIFCM